MRTWCWIFVTLCVVGCGVRSSMDPKKGPSTEEPTSVEEHGHSHERGKMMLADAGKYHALLTAHLSKSGHELDLFFETTSRKPTPVAVPLTSLKASVQVRSGEGALKEIEFTPAPDAERPAGEAPGTCSHFVAKAPWLDPDAPHRIIIRAKLNGADEEIRWNDFLPRKFAHHTD